MAFKWPGNKAALSQAANLMDHERYQWCYYQDNAIATLSCPHLVSFVVQMTNGSTS